jgi:hypothetical protein
MIDRRQLFLIASALLLAGRAEAHSFTQGAIEIGHPWARPTATRDGAVYLVLATRGTIGDHLVGASTPFAERVEIRDELGNPVDGLDILPKRPFALRPGRRSLALIGLKQPLSLGDNFPLLLHFRDAGDAAVTVMVETAPGA